MKAIFSFFLALAAICVLGLAGYGFVSYYPFIFSRRVVGVLLSVDRVQLNVSLMQSGGDKVDPTLFSFAVAIREDSGEIITASAEDRQWAAAQRGLCAEATYYPYPPWKVMKSGTYFNARLDRLFECPDKAAKLPPINGSPAIPAPPPGSVPPLEPAHPPMPAPTAAPSKIPTH